VLARAKELLKRLEAEQLASPAVRPGGSENGQQLALFAAPDPAVAELASLNTDEMTPLQALQRLSLLVRQVQSR
jgi:DNA mismatch repair ATPase MutS